MTGSTPGVVRRSAPKTGSTSAHRYAAFLRGVSPMNCKMAALKSCLEGAGFEDVKTVLSSGNVVFSGRAMPEAALVAGIEAAIQQGLDRSFPVIVRPVEALRALLASDPYRPFRLAPGSKRVVTFLKEAPGAIPALPLEVDGARILCVRGREAFTSYVRSPRGPVFMTLIEKTFGKNVTTRTWETLEKVAR
ncbi:MAG: DUF1697 domain-containing protein [Deltaproteobacteria bacterium]|nr:DUF1697 domain-containing protein [Deltaproteobacteria bacterium]